MAKRELSEERLQQECYMWFHNTYPQYRGLLNYNLNNSKNAIDGMKNKAMGLQAGRADMELLFNGSVYFLELKTKTGRQQPVQKKWQELVEARGFQYHIVRDVQMFSEVIKKIFAG